MGVTSKEFIIDDMSNLKLRSAAEAAAEAELAVNKEVLVGDCCDLLPNSRDERFGGLNSDSVRSRWGEGVLDLGKVKERDGGEVGDEEEDESACDVCDNLSWINSLTSKEANSESTFSTGVVDLTPNKASLVANISSGDHPEPFKELSVVIVFLLLLV